ncbi:hypothetical protein [Acidovorax sp. NCPPB 4044]|uniref:hypothetical protein n=1 Tax=Acidovorax sp. NCPPB 4044 TaxID=2940490 RepID=UPI002304ACEF|nr:hypothetical protein [Acidovorax sp. NCPPB 4044]MDA8523443.1 hypothetical protein [Acidovorax sp. NCPPB 4044]
MNKYGGMGVFGLHRQHGAGPVRQHQEQRQRGTGRRDGQHGGDLAAHGHGPAAAQINGRLYAIDADHLNTPRRLTNAQGQVVCCG